MRLAAKAWSTWTQQSLRVDWQWGLCSCVICQSTPKAPSVLVDKLGLCSLKFCISSPTLLAALTPALLLHLARAFLLQSFLQSTMRWSLSLKGWNQVSVFRNKEREAPLGQIYILLCDRQVVALFLQVSTCKPLSIPIEQKLLRWVNGIKCNALQRTLTGTGSLPTFFCNWIDSKCFLLWEHMLS